jgi:hypothetical protein
MDTLRFSVVTRCPGGSGCRCSEHYGLAEYMHALTGKDYGLPKRDAPLRAVPLPLSLSDEVCEGTLVCGCSRCENERAQRVNRPPRQPKQPWEIAA